MIWITKLSLKNFKSIENEEIKFNKGLNILLGPNNAGKSNIIEAIDILLGDINLSRFEPTTDHFFNGEENREIIIEAELECDKDELSLIDPSFKDKIQIRFKYLNEDNKSFEVLINNKLFQKKTNPLSYYWNFEKKLRFLKIKSLRNIMEIAPIRWKSPLKYFKDKIIKKDSQKIIDEVIKQIESAKKKLSESTETKQIINALLSISKDQTEIKNISFSPASTKSSDILNEMKIFIDDGYNSEANNKGLGTQNLIIISLFRLMAKYLRDYEKKFVIYGIEEPEIGLHPHAQRQLIHSLKKLSEFSQVIITTHSDRLVDISQIDSIIRIGKSDNKTKHYTINLNHEEKRILEVHGKNLNELFFSKRCLIVEGETEEGFFLEVSKKIVEFNKEHDNKVEENFSFDYNSVSVINGGGDKIWFFVKLVKILRIPFILLIDEDKTKDKNKFLHKLKIENIISSEEYEIYKKDNNFKEELKSKKGIFILSPFETIICNHCNNLQKVEDAINFVKENWGEDVYSLENNALDRKERVFQLLKKNKKWRIGKAIAQNLSKEEIPAPYIEIIKKVSKL